MFTRVTIQGSLVALQQHIRSKAPAGCARDRSHSLDGTGTPGNAIDQRPIHVGENHTAHSSFQYTGTQQPVAVDYLSGWGSSATTVSGQQFVSSDEPEEIISYECVQDDVPSATYHYGTREAVVDSVCNFLELWLNSTRHGSSNPHGWECLRRPKTMPEGAPACGGNGYNNYNTAHASCGHAHHYLYGTTIPTISMKDYLMRLTEYFRTTDAVFIIAAHYFSRVIEAHDRQQSDAPLEARSSIVTPWSLHRIYFACCVLAAKWLEDTPFDNQYYASVGGISTFELNKVETALLSLLDFNVFVSRDAVDGAWDALQKTHLGELSTPFLALPAPRWVGVSASQSSSSSSSSHQLSVAAAPFRPNSTPAANWCRSQTPVFPYQCVYSQYNAGGYGF